MEQNCIFCKIVAGQIPCAKVHEDSRFLAFMDIMPAVKGHTLVIPKAHYEGFLSMPREVAEGLAGVVQYVAQAVTKAIGTTACKVETFNGQLAGQSVPHVHFHIIPRSQGDGLEHRADKNWWAQRKELYAAGEMAQVADSIRSKLS